MKTRLPILVGNWKMHKTIREACLYLDALIPLISNCQEKIFLAVPFTMIQRLASKAEESSIVIGAQNMNDAEKGAFTGEIAGFMLKEAGAQFVLLGHSERRRLFHEDDACINKKVRRALIDALQPILCVGESLKERESGSMKKVLMRQLKEGLRGVEQPQDLVIAYEPVWAIGSLSAATPEVVKEAHCVCREVLLELFGERGEQVPILYGGSVTSENAALLAAQPYVDGLLIGSASLSAENFAKIVHLVHNVTKISVLP